MRTVKQSFLFALAVASMVSCKNKTEEDPQGLTRVQGHVFKPALVPASDANVSQLKLPAGFAVNKFAENLGKPRMITVGAAGQVYVTDREAGKVTLLQDTNGDGVSDAATTVLEKESVHGITIHNNKMYLVTIKEVLSADINANGSLGTPQILISDLPDAGQHPNRTIAFGPDGFMYITVGSTCNACDEPNEEHATVLRANADGTNRTVYAKGLRNTIGFGWHPQTGEMWGMDHGIDWLGDEEQHEELNKIVQGANYGWPYIYDDGKFNPQPSPKGDTTYQQYLALTTLPVLLYQAHSAPLGMVFYSGTQFPTEYQNSAFITMRGSWNRRVPSGYKVVRLRFENGQPTVFEDFLTGFLVNNNRDHFARIVGITTHTDGSLLITDDTNGVVYRVAYNGQ